MSPSASEIRQSVDFPIVDSDGHMNESQALFFAHLDDVAGPAMVDRLQAELRANPLASFGDAETGTARVSVWSHPNDARDLATSMVPGLLYDRLDEIGIDFAFIYPTFGLFLPTLQDPELRAAAVRAENAMNAASFGPYRDRLAPVAVVPMHTPAEAVAEIDHVTSELDYRAVYLPAAIARPVPAYADAFPVACTLDQYGLDSAHDYDPVWRRLDELGIPASFHAGLGMRFMPGGKRSPSNFVYNHVQGMAYFQSNLALSLYMAGVPRGFPHLRFGFLESGVSWACDLLWAIEEHWEKRNIRYMREHLDPALLDTRAFDELVARHGADTFARIGLDRVRFLDGTEAVAPGQGPKETDDFALSGVLEEEDIPGPFVEGYYFGCEADDRTLVRAFDTANNAFGSTLRPLFGSDIGHWDVQRISDVLGETYELVEDGHLTLEQWRAFVSDNPLRFWAGGHPELVAGTVLEGRVAPGDGAAPGGRRP